ncbi:dipeptide ABC transporter ATP-binding protein [Neobacillus sp. MM2021_6]|uniref:ABC transporter ATP-binding protein n=1 Tax=Bacillaceae TaxID=186817 RepID=UPI00140AC3B3|nr:MULTISPECIES: dipeptide ABC transporter ATP-binding protein [Bacillaceae]MBO0961019.1 dipeptide ABC transporter ATP-binding protein [Neobacillus sp. MM2021_6]NHC19069.1 dipeptide ABC transporter ATP-binding protein [Bacillus sp. MM2020_4]
MSVLAANKETPLLHVKNLKKFFPVTNSLGRVTGQVKAVNNVSFEINAGETYGLVGESGCGKSTTGRTVMRLLEPTSGEGIYQGKDLYSLKGKELHNMRKDLQMVFQDPYSSLNPRKRIGHILEETLKIHRIGDKKERMERVMDMLNRVGFQSEQYYRYPHEFSGGQRQRIGLARALMVNPKLIICDEPVSALDVSIQSQVLNLLEEIQDEFHLSYLFISHDLSVVRHISDRIGVMYLGQLVEESPTDELYANPLHPYTKALLSAVPVPNPTVKRDRIKLSGEVPSPLNPPSGCVFHTRCPHATDICKREVPVKKRVSADHAVACHLF